MTCNILFLMHVALVIGGLMPCGGVPAVMGGRELLAVGSFIIYKLLILLVFLRLLPERGILSAAGFSGMVAMALATTMLARPLAGILFRR